MDDDAKRAQVAAQCKVVAHLATALAEMHEDYAAMFQGGRAGSAIDMVGERTAKLMETLGDILNGMDAASEEDEWTHPIFAEAQRLWPNASHRKGDDAQAELVRDIVGQNRKEPCS